jgi:NAD(P)-dependent dehydrogenase (short-subunit alcohol dehydrogenase family)
MLQQSERFKGKTVLITGGNSGMGFATAKRIVSEGGRVMITGRDEKTLRQAQVELGSNAEAIRSDVSQLKEIDSLFEKVKQKYGKIDALFANAGVSKPSPIEQVTESDFDRLFDINVKGVYFTLQKAIPFLEPGSSVVLNASVIGSRGIVESSVYGATKAAVRSFGRSFSAEFVSRGIRFNVISPGPIDTPIWERGGLSAGAAAARKQAVTNANPMKRYGTPDEVAAAVTFLLSPDSTYILGVELIVDGGGNQL